MTRKDFMLNDSPKASFFRKSHSFFNVQDEYCYVRAENDKNAIKYVIILMYKFRLNLTKFSLGHDAEDVRRNY